MGGLWGRLKSVGFDAILSNMKDYHIPIFVMMFFVGVAVAIFKPAAMTMTLVAYTSVIVGGILGHAFSPYSRNGDDSSGNGGQSGDGTPH